MSESKERCAVKSMTGFARVSGVADEVDLEVEIRSVNHRFFECTVRGPRGLWTIERELRALIQQEHKRGRFDVTVSRRPQSSTQALSVVLPKHLQEIVSLYAGACKQLGVGTDGMAHFIGQLILRELGSLSDTSEIPTTELPHIMNLVKRCSEAVRQCREVEGAALVLDIDKRIAVVKALHQVITERVAGGSARLREKMIDRLSVVSQEIRVDPERLASEIAIMADRIDVSEELSRLSIHLSQFSTLLGHGHPEGIGRKLDFMVQEISRELNTIGSKAQDAEVQGSVVEAKAELEKAREQIQNIE